MDDTDITLDLHDDLEEFPLLKDVVKTGDPNIIASSRQAFEKTEADNYIFAPNLPEEMQPESISQAVTEQQLEELVDDIVKAHTENMRRDILKVFKRVLEQNRGKTTD